MRKRQKKETTIKMAIEFLLDECRHEKSLRPLKYVFGRYRYGSRNQLKGGLLKYAGYCKRTKRTMYVC